MSLQPGPFRTGMLAKVKDSIHSELYPEIDAQIRKYAQTGGQEPGDPVKGARRIIEVMTREGELPERFVLGQAAYDMTKAKLEERLREMEQWKNESLGVEYE